MREYYMLKKHVDGLIWWWLCTQSHMLIDSTQGLAVRVEFTDNRYTANKKDFEGSVQVMNYHRNWSEISRKTQGFQLKKTHRESGNTELDCRGLLWELDSWALEPGSLTRITTFVITVAGRIDDYKVATVQSVFLINHDQSNTQPASPV